MDERVGVAVIGAGYWGTKLVTEYLAAERRGKVKLLKVYDPSLSALGALLIRKETAPIGQTRLTQDIAEVMNDPEISAVHIATPNATHFEIARAALEAGKNVLVEKPMTLNPHEAYDLVDLAASRGLVIKVGHIFRHNSAVRAAREILRNGELGKFYYVRVQWTDACPPFPDRDIVFDLGPHPVDILNQLLDSWPIQVSSVSRGYRTENSEVAYVIAEFQGGIFAHIELSWLHPTKVREVTVVGSEGSLTVDCLNQRVTKSIGKSSTSIPVIANNTIRDEIMDFVESVRLGFSSHETRHLGPHTIEVLDKIRTSIWERPLPVTEPAEYGHALAMIDLLERAKHPEWKKHLTNESAASSSEPDKYAGILLGSGLLRSVVAGDGTSYEITEGGRRFLDEYRALGRNEEQKIRTEAQIEITETSHGQSPSN